MDGASFSVPSALSVLNVLPLPEKGIQHRGHGDHREILRERNWEGSRCAGLEGGDFRHSDDSVRCHSARREITQADHRRGEFQEPLGGNENVNHRNGPPLRKWRSRYRNPAFRTAPFRQWTRDSHSTAKSQEPPVGLRLWPFPASSFRPWTCCPWSCRQAPSLGIRFAGHGNPSASKQKHRRHRRPRPTRLRTAAALRSSPRICA
jgi:hypothetical protein